MVRVQPGKKQPIGESLRVDIGEFFFGQTIKQGDFVEVPQRMERGAVVGKHGIGGDAQKAGAAGQLPCDSFRGGGGGRCRIEKGFQHRLQGIQGRVENLDCTVFRRVGQECRRNFVPIQKQPEFGMIGE